MNGVDPSRLWSFCKKVLMFWWNQPVVQLPSLLTSCGCVRRQARVRCGSGQVLPDAAECRYPAAVRRPRAGVAAKSVGHSPSLPLDAGARHGDGSARTAEAESGGGASPSLPCPTSLVPSLCHGPFPRTELSSKSRKMLKSATTISAPLAMSTAAGTELRHRSTEDASSTENFKSYSGLLRTPHVRHQVSKSTRHQIHSGSPLLSVRQTRIDGRGWWRGQSYSTPQLMYN